eukprot:CAMPEP_0167764300 /NCGR_PEP_ID=MMETSP0110_2-20121227/13946_1 /TAXON_ID=629695 /ORGANISM="Gymnochlora sp., Strain CCMP2014" /LENGTH=190 /DNA_ID=CAMNT_0007651669 /DNA_START=15 /DNA_END=587 /DNA_ORIENTATION=+
MAVIETKRPNRETDGFEVEKPLKGGVGELMEIKVEAELPDRKDLCMLCHCCCVQDSLYFDFPGCCGLVFTGACCCCTSTESCKCLQFEENTRVFLRSTCQCIRCDLTGENFICCRDVGKGVCCCCLTYAFSYSCDLAFLTCIKAATQVLCIDSRCALPCDEDVPMGIGCLSFYCLQPDEPEKTDAPADNA